MCALEINGRNFIDDEAEEYNGFVDEEDECKFIFLFVASGILDSLRCASSLIRAFYFFLIRKSLFMYELSRMYKGAIQLKT